MRWSADARQRARTYSASFEGLPTPLRLVVGLVMGVVGAAIALIILIPLVVLVFLLGAVAMLTYGVRTIVHSIGRSTTKQPGRAPSGRRNVRVLEKR